MVIIILQRDPEKTRLLATELNQGDFAKAVGMSKRTYQSRVLEKDQDWKISELIAISKFNKGQVSVRSKGVNYSIQIEEIGE